MFSRDYFHIFGEDKDKYIASMKQKRFIKGEKVFWNNIKQERKSSFLHLISQNELTIWISYEGILRCFVMFYRKFMWDFLFCFLLSHVSNRAVLLIKGINSEAYTRAYVFFGIMYESVSRPSWYNSGKVWSVKLQSIINGKVQCENMGTTCESLFSYLQQMFFG